MKGNESAEALHKKGAGKGQKTDPKFVNKGTSDNPLVKFSDLESPETSKSGSQALKDGLIKE